ncbi:hypothetical protein GJ496_002042 [Pomphorhynchus laevis]|nr:hypothetical protein GJ496_002042 [Pomphorhynchus laevis]
MYSSSLFILIDLDLNVWSDEMKSKSLISVAEMLNAIIPLINANVLLSDNSRLVIFVIAGEEKFDIVLDVKSRERDANECITALISNTKQFIDSLKYSDLWVIGDGSALIACLIRSIIMLVDDEACNVDKAPITTLVDKSSSLVESKRILLFTRHVPTLRLQLTNVIFACQNNDIAIDICLLLSKNESDNIQKEEETLLVQACQLTKGHYLRLTQINLIYIFAAYLPMGSLKAPKFICKDVYSSEQDDFGGIQPACFCHGRPLSLGFVCSVCLAIYCTYLPFCSNCKSFFPVKMSMIESTDE